MSDQLLAQAAKCFTASTPQRQTSQWMTRSGRFGPMSEVVCHNDWLPHNIVARDRGSDRLGHFVVVPARLRLGVSRIPSHPAHGLGHPAGLAPSDAERARRLALPCEAYGGDIDPEVVVDMAVRQLEGLRDFTVERARGQGSEELARHAVSSDKDAAYIRGVARLYPPAQAPPLEPGRQYGSRSTSPRVMLSELLRSGGEAWYEMLAVDGYYRP